MSASSSALPPRGLPILSGPPPVIESGVCRQCAKTFNPLWRRAHACGHCGYEYCSNCLSDGQALMPRRAATNAPSSTLNAIKEELGIGSSKNVGGGYEVESVCLPCLSMLQVTAAPVETVRSLPLKRLKDYLSAYNISCIGPKEKEDFVQAVLKARNPATGCLSPEAESYYRRHSVPKTTNIELSDGNPRVQARPPTRPSPSVPNGNSRPPPPRPTNASSSGQYRPHAQARPPQQHSAPSQQQHYRPPPRPTFRPPPARPSAPPAPAKTQTPPPPVPTILSLVSLPKSYLNSLSIGTLKAILYENHVRVDFKQVLEKQELINRVDELIRDERKRLERQRIEEERQAAEARGEHAVAKEATPEEEHAGDKAEGEASTAKETVPTGPMPEVERGLCVVCQDEEATLAVVDCGHLAMCAHCSDLVMATSKECPLCRTRIVTPARLIRIYRV